MQNNNIKVLFLPAWYPNKTDSMAGLFVKYHALALLPYVQVAVLHIITVGTKQKNTVEYNYIEDDRLPTVIAYIQKQPNNFLDKFLYPFRYFLANYKGYKLIKQHFGQPNLHHVHILTRSGILALYKKITTGTPYLITEHWSRYLPQNRGSYTGGFRKWLTQRIVKNASAVTTVSKHLGKAMQSHSLNNTYYQISNVVDVNYFKPLSPKPVNAKPVFLHVSCFDEKPKNVKGILNATKTLVEKGFDFELRLIGDGKDHQMCVDYCNNLQLQNVVFTGLKTGNDLLKEYQTADAFVMFSRFENQPVVLLEAFACSLPVIATKVGGIPEIVQPDFGFLIDSEDEAALAQAMQQVIEGDTPFNKEAMRQHAVKNYSYAGVGQQFYDIYKNIVKQ